MKHSKVAILFSLLLVGLGSSLTMAQSVVDEQHYLVYVMPDPATFVETILLTDQFGGFTADQFVLTHFATPTEKAIPGGPVSPMLDPRAHQTWWELFNPQEERQVSIDNQFGRQEIVVRDGRFLVLPAGKDIPDIAPRNHYECYEAEGLAVDQLVILTDQFGTFDVQVLIPALFCNPLAKTRASGEFYPIIDVEAHLTCYDLDPPHNVVTGHNAFDQFGSWNVRPTTTQWLCVPTFKLTAIGAENTSWGKIKSLYN